MLEARQREIEEELSLAARVQQTLAPGSLTWEGVSVEAFYEPVRRIGGDFGVVAPRADCLSILVCDVCGYGISSALVANWIYFETVSQIEDSVELGTMLHHLNRFVLRNLASSGLFFTLAAARLSRRRRALEFAGAGHPPAMMVRRSHEPRLLESRSAVLGLLENAVDPEAQNSFPSRCGGRLNRRAMLPRHVGVSADPARWGIRHAMGAESLLRQSCSDSNIYIVQAGLGDRWAARESIRRAVPLNSMLIPTSVPITHSDCHGHSLQMMTTRITVTIPSKSSQPQPGRGRRRNDKINPNISLAKR